MTHPAPDGPSGMLGSNGGPAPPEGSPLVIPPESPPPPVRPPYTAWGWERVGDPVRGSDDATHATLGHATFEVAVDSVSGRVGLETRIESGSKWIADAHLLGMLTPAGAWTLAERLAEAVAALAAGAVADDLVAAAESLRALGPVLVPLAEGATRLVVSLADLEEQHGDAVHGQADVREDP